MPRERKGLTPRKSQKRDARTFFVIATEGYATEKKYFNGLETKANPKVKIEVLEKDSTASSPKDVLEALDAYAKEYVLVDGDELWVVIDRDSWSAKMIKNIAQACHQKANYFFALSNPCFEFWLLLHVAKVESWTDEVKKEFFENKKVSKTRTRLEKELLDILGSYNKRNPDLSHFLPHVQKAIVQAKYFDVNPENRWIDGLGTRVYLLVEKLI